MKSVLCASILMANALAQVSFDRALVSTPPQPATGKGLIEGTVLNSVTHEPMNRVHVTLGGMVNLTAVTDAAGHFAFKDLAPGQFFLQAQTPNLRQRVDPGSTRMVKLGAEEQVHDVSLSITPPGTISGHVVDDEGSPLPACNVTAHQFQYFQGQKTLAGVASGNTNETGEYQIRELPAGKYYVQAHCYREIPLPHAFMERNSPDAPMLSYAPMFYPGSLDISGASRITVGPGADAAGNDFRMAPSAGVTLKGRVVAADADAIQGNVRISLEPHDAQNGHQPASMSRFDKASGKFQFKHVAPGSYDLVVNTLGEGRPQYARVPVEVGSEPLDPIDVPLSVAPSLSGSIQVEGDLKVSFDSLRLMFVSRDFWHNNPQPNVKVNSDGSFVIATAMPGKWQLMVNGINGYIKKMSLGDQDINTDYITIPSGAPGALKIVMAASWASLDVTMSSPPVDGEQFSAMIWNDQGPNQTQRVMNADPSGGAVHSMNMPPGHYHVCGVEAMDWSIFQNVPLLKKLESRCSSVDLEENGKSSVQLGLVSKQDLVRLTAEVDN
ncbi:MAG TPA: carboxypeptidase-like regulatory domain-containing protein [Bryobacteraceae bacterium]|nr:carboxypeptidase-like regulatory domain-containing protein [Bryobacteraceae bacterium]